MTTYSVGIARRGPNVEGWVLDLQGCRAVGGSIDEVMGLLPVAIAEHAVWLKGHGDAVDPTSLDFKVVEDFAPEGDYAFEADKAPLSTAELLKGVGRLRFALDDLRSISAPLPDVILDWKPPASSVRIDEIFPDVRTIRQMLDHAAGSVLNFARRVMEDPDAAPAPQPDPFVNGAAGLKILGSLSEKERASVYRRPNPRGGGEADWTARKVLRRVTQHQRFHAREVGQRLGWLSLGVPEVLPSNRE